MSRMGFIVDTGRCVACKACIVACQIANPGSGPSPWRTVTSTNPLRFPGLELVSLSLACNHCEEAPCAKNCPALAYRRDRVTGLMMHTEKHCIGCRYCTWVCPYDAPKFNHDKGVIGKCTGCQPRQAEGMEPACVEGCPTGALAWGDMEAPVKEVPGLPKTDIGPGLRVLPGRKPRQPVMETRDVQDIAAYYQKVGITESKRVSLNEEWTLMAFTILACLQVAWFYSVFTGRDETSVSGFVLSAMTGLFLSVMHLGKRVRAWRALVNVKRSWVSREVTGYGFFLTSAMVWMTSPFGDIPGWIALAAGFYTLWSMDMVYQRIAQHGRPYLHSAGIFSFMVFMYIGFFAGIQWLFFGVVGLRFLLYLSRKSVRLRSKSRFCHTTELFRVVIGFLLPVLLSLFGRGDWMEGMILILLITGDILDRSEFYREIEIVAPG